MKISKRDAKAITTLMDTLREWSESFVEGAYAKDWAHYWGKLEPRLIEFEKSLTPAQKLKRAKKIILKK